jgi:RHO1 GDP-GTP exchange protein 1/2
MTKPKEKDGIVKYHVNRRVCLLLCYPSWTVLTASLQPIPLELLSLATFSDPPQQRGTAFLKGFQRGSSVGSSTSSANGTATENVTDSRSVFPLTIHHNGRMGGLYTLYAETADARSEWKRKLEEALALRSVIQDSNKVIIFVNVNEPLIIETACRCLNSNL